VPDTARDQTNEAGQQRPLTAAKQWHRPSGATGLLWRVGNGITGLLARAGIGPVYLLTTRGRKTGHSRITPVVPVEHDGKHWLVAPYGAVTWVHNARAAGQVSLRHGRKTRDYAIREVSPGEAGPVLKRYVAVASVARPYFRAGKDSPVGDFVAEADRHPVFELTPLAEVLP
jgi:deazaflavin-dependent oxidoreductase (nitroreductase family)